MNLKAQLNNKKLCKFWWFNKPKIRMIEKRQIIIYEEQEEYLIGG